MKLLKRRLQGLCLLVVFGLVCGLLAGIISGIGFGIPSLLLTVVNPLPASESGVSGAEIFLFAAGWGGVVSVPAGLTFGLVSYFFSEKIHWLVGGVFCALPTIVLGLHSAMVVEWFLLSISAGFLAGLFNAVKPRWWGRSIHEEAVSLLKK